MGSCDLSGYSDDKAKREAFYDKLVDKLPLEVIEKIIPYCDEPQIVNLDWGDFFRSMRDLSYAGTKTFDSINEIGDKSDCAFILAIFEVKGTWLPPNTEEVMNDFIGDNEIMWCGGKAEKDQVILLEFAQSI